MFIDYIINNLMNSIVYDRPLDSSFSIYNCRDTEFKNHKNNVLYFIPTFLCEEDLINVE